MTTGDAKANAEKVGERSPDWGGAFSRLERMENALSNYSAMVEYAYFGERLEAWRSLAGDLAKAMPDNPAISGFKVYSQNDEDGIIADCLKRIGKEVELDKTCIELACGDGSENNTHLLLLDGFRGVWIDGEPSNIETIGRRLGGLHFGRLSVFCEKASLAGLPRLLDRCLERLGTDQVDLFSLDVDGNDLHFAEVVAARIQPKMFVLEYNAKFPPPLSLTMDYDESFQWRIDDFFGASLQAFADKLDGYALVACNMVGINAFFVREDLMRHFTKYPVSELYMPPRYALACPRLGHRPSLKWLRQSLGKCLD